LESPVCARVVDPAPLTDGLHAHDRGVRTHRDLRIIGRRDHLGATVHAARVAVPNDFLLTLAPWAAEKHVSNCRLQSESPSNTILTVSDSYTRNAANRGSTRR